MNVTFISQEVLLVGRRAWVVGNYMSGFVGDVGELSELIMAESGYRDVDDLAKRIDYELSDCLWSALVLADELKVDLVRTFPKIAELLSRIEGSAK